MRPLATSIDAPAADFHAAERNMPPLEGNTEAELKRPRRA